MDFNFIFVHLNHPLNKIGGACEFRTHARVTSSPTSLAKKPLDHLGNAPYLVGKSGIEPESSEFQSDA